MEKVREPVVVGNVYGRLTVLAEASRDAHRMKRWLCRCECGKEKSVNHYLLRDGKTKSCGCLFRETVTRHGRCFTPEHSAWTDMISRCQNQNNKHYHRYGGRGISVCERWRNSFLDFLADMGHRPSPSHSLDRFPNNDGNYEPGNVRWATKKEQSNNRSDNRRLVIDGETLTAKECQDRFGVHRNTICHRLDHGWSDADAVSNRRYGPRKKLVSGTP